MNKGILCGLTAALCYGITDYATGHGARAVGVWRSLFYGDLLVLLILTAWLPHGAREVSLTFADRGAWAACIAAGLILFAASALLTRGLAVGTLAVVAPVTATYGAITALLSVASGEHLTVTAAAGLAITVVGVCVVSIPPEAGGAFKEHLRLSGFLWAAGAVCCYGVGLWMQGTLAVPVLGSFVPVWLAYVIATGAVALICVPARMSLAFPHRRALPPVLVTGVTSGIANVALTFGLGTGEVAIVVVLSTLTSAITVLLARILDKSRVAVHQWGAMLLIVIGLIVLRR